MPVRAFLLALLTLVSGGWVGDALKGDELWADWLPEGLNPWWARLAAVLLFLLSAWGLFLRRRELMSVGALSQERPEPRRAVVLSLSPPNPPPELEDGRATRVGTLPLTGVLDRDVRALTDAGMRWSWQQLLRALEPHRGMLEHVYLLGSADAAGSPGTYRHLDAAEGLIRLYFPDAHVMRAPAPVSFEDVRALMKAMERAIRTLTVDAGLREEDVTIDVTGGYKPTSIAAAVMTLNCNATFQYVHTGGNHEVWEYDLLHRASSQV